MKHYTIQLPSFNREIVDAALLRIQTIFPEADALVVDNEIQFLANSNEEALERKREISNILYREKMFTETNTIRSALFTT